MWPFFSVCVSVGGLVYITRHLTESWVRVRGLETYPVSAPQSGFEKHEEEPLPDPMPTDLFNMALTESEPWAREEMVKRMYELYNETHDWSKVRGMWYQAPASDEMT